MGWRPLKRPDLVVPHQLDHSSKQHTVHYTISCMHRTRRTQHRGLRRLAELLADRIVGHTAHSTLPTVFVAHLGLQRVH